MLLTMSDWWQAMNTVEKIYWCFAIPFSVLFVLQIILTFFVGDDHDVSADGDADISVEHDMGIDFQFITLKNLIAFFTIFGWTGIACLDGGLSNGVSLIIATVGGLIMMVIMASIVYFMGKLTESGTLNLNNAIGKIGSVYLTIPAKRKGLGKVQVKVQGFQTLDAMSDEEEPIKTGSIVTVTEIINDEILLVRPSTR